MKKSRKHFALIILLIMAGSFAIAAPSYAMTWNVLAGGQTPDMALQGLGFYPGVITINEEDTINWTLGGNLVHTISFLSGSPPPSPDSQNAVTPSGGSTYDGTGIVSSGLLTPGMNYSLTFTKAGIYIYQCLLHPGMSGLVIVQPVNSSYPSNQTQYIAQGKKELLSDINTGQKLANNVSLTTSSEPDGTTIFHASADIPLSMNTNVVLAATNGSNVTGNAVLNITAPGTLQVQTQLSGLVANSAVSANIYIGTNKTGGTVLYPLNTITADINGNGNSTTIINPGFAWFAIASKGWFINVSNGTVPIASGNIVVQDAMYARFTPKNLTVHAGDQVEWTALNPMEIHTVTFPGAGPLPVFPNPDAVTPAGGNIHNGTGFYNSGILHVGDKYTLTFNVPGNYSYACLVHDDLGMAGNIAVELPIKPVITDFVVAPDTAISESNPAIESGNVAVGINNIMQVEFGIIDTNNVIGIGGNGSAILVFDRNITGDEGLYQSEPWGGTFASIGNFAISGNVAITANIAVSEPITVYTTSDMPGFFQARGTLNDSKKSTEAILWFDKTTLNLSNVTNITGTALNIKDGSSTFMGKTFKYINGAISDMPELTSGQIFNLFNITGNMSSNNPVLMFKDVPQDKYKAYVIVRDSGGNNTTMVADIDTIIPSVPSGGGRSSGGGSSGGGYNSQGNGTTGTGNQAAPTETITSVPTSTEVTPFPTATEVTTTVQTPTVTPTKGAPGFEVIAAIGVLSAIYIFVRKRR